MAAHWDHLASFEEQLTPLSAGCNWSVCNTNIRLSVFFKGFYLFSLLAVLGLHCCSGSSLVVVSGANSLVLVRGLLIVVASLVAERGL